jgi:hypothetical protein
MFRGVSGTCQLTLPSASRRAKAAEASPTDNSFTEQLFPATSTAFPKGWEGKGTRWRHSTRQNLSPAHADSPGV